MVARHNRGRISHRLLESLESRLLMTASFSTNDVDLAWSYIGMSANGSLEFDNANNVAAATLVDDTGATLHPTGTYTIDAEGPFSLTLNTPASPQGSINNQRSEISLSEIGENNSLALLINPASGTNLASLIGSWGLYYNGDGAAGSGLGTISFDGAGKIKPSTFKDAGGTSSIKSGTYTVSPSGNVTVDLVVRQPSGATVNLSLVGTLNSSKDLLALNPADLAAAGNQTRMFVAVKHTGSFAKSDAIGTWELSGDDTNGAITIDAAGKITGSYTNSSGVFTVTGTATLTPTGAVTLKISAVNGPTTIKTTYTATMNTSRSIIAANVVSTQGEGMLVLNFIGNRAPTLSKISSFTGAMASVDFEIPFATLLNAANESDRDGDALSFRIQSVGSGTLLLNNNPIGAFPAIFSAGDTLTWTPDLAAKGKVTAFYIRAYDGTSTSAADIPVVVNVNAAPVLSVIANKPLASENTNGTTTGVGSFTFTRTGNINVPLDITYTINTAAGNSADGGTDYQALTGTVHFDAKKNSVVVQVKPTDDLLVEGTESVTVVLDPKAHFMLNPTKNSAIVNIADYELSPESVANGNFVASISSGTGAFAKSGKFTLVFGSDDTHYVMLGYGTLPTTDGTFTYARTSSIGAELTFVDSVLGNFTGTLTFSNAKTAKFNFTDGGTGTQKGSGTFVASPLFAPATIGGSTLNAKITSGKSPEVSAGSFLMALSQNSNHYAVTSGTPGVAGTGDYTYTQFSNSLGILTFTNEAASSAVKIGTGIDRNTGLKLAQDTPDPNWIMGPNSSTGLVGLRPVARTTNIPPQYVDDGDSPNSMWIGVVTGNGQQGLDGAGTYEFVTTIDLSSFDPSTLTLENAFVSGDDYVESVAINGTIVYTSTNDGFGSLNALPAGLGAGEFKTGVNTLAFTVHNGGLTQAFRFEGEITSTVPSRITNMMMVFSSAKNASYLITDDAGGKQAGTLTLNAPPIVNFTPLSIDGLTIHGNVTAGGIPYIKTGQYTMLMDTTTYTATAGPAISNSTGTYTYEAYNGNLGVLVIDDSIAGSSVQFLTFTSTTKAGYVLSTLRGINQRGNISL